MSYHVVPVCFLVKGQSRAEAVTKVEGVINSIRTRVSLVWLPNDPTLEPWQDEAHDIVRGAKDFHLRWVVAGPQEEDLGAGVSYDPERGMTDGSGDHDT